MLLLLLVCAAVQADRAGEVEVYDSQGVPVV
jgi:hypothetical protein